MERARDTDPVVQSRDSGAFPQGAPYFFIEGVLSVLLPPWLLAEGRKLGRCGVNTWRDVTHVTLQVGMQMM